MKHAVNMAERKKTKKHKVRFVCLLSRLCLRCCLHVCLYMWLCITNVKRVSICDCLLLICQEIACVRTVVSLCVCVCACVFYTQNLAFVRSCVVCVCQHVLKFLCNNVVWGLVWCFFLCNSALWISIYECVPNLSQVLGDYGLSQFGHVLGHLGTVARLRAGYTWISEPNKLWKFFPHVIGGKSILLHPPLLVGNTDSGE